jgi:hypothetical protein
MRPSHPHGTIPPLGRTLTKANRRMVGLAAITAVALASAALAGSHYSGTQAGPSGPAASPGASTLPVVSAPARSGPVDAAPAQPAPGLRAGLGRAAKTDASVVSNSTTVTLLSQGMAATASSSQDPAYYPASAAVDGDPGTRWASTDDDPQWLQVDLVAVDKITRIALDWEAAYAKAFKIQTSLNGRTWTTIYSTTDGTGGKQNLEVTGTGRYVRMYGTQRATQYGYSLWEFQI